MRRAGEDGRLTVVNFSEDQPRPLAAEENLMLDLDGFEGPIDVLLQLAREQKVDLTKISILALAEQYLAFVQAARRVRLELAADYLVMAAWLAYLKSRLLLPEPDGDGEEPSGAEMAAALKFQLQRLQAMRDVGALLVARPQLGRDVFARGCPESPKELTTLVYDTTLFDLLRAYGDIQGRAKGPGGLRIVSLNLYSVEEAIRRLSSFLGEMPGWKSLASFLPRDLRDPLMMRSAIASTFAASLQLCKSGDLRMRQDNAFGPIYLKAREPGEAEAAATLDEPVGAKASLGQGTRRDAGKGAETSGSRD